ncbi:Ig-like domain-containing protein [Paenibacillus sp. GYB003]|uniref:Ig-like domain-containing protein n=1 Tax=Paenibacillus sp. GYB003 TaxID=2994392 RepID=UPI002F96DED7
MNEFTSRLDLLEPRGNIRMTPNEEGIAITCPRDDGAVMAPGKYAIPLKIDLTAKTDSTHIRLKYGNGAVILNWERNEQELRVHDPVGGNYCNGVVGKGKIPVDEFVDISWIVDKDYMLLLVNGEVRLFRKNQPYMKPVTEGAPFPELEVGVASAMGSVVTIKELHVSQWNHAEHDSEPLAFLLPNKAYVKEGETITLEGRVFPDTAANKKVTWVSDSKHVAVADPGDGTVRIAGVEKGTAEVRGITEAGHISAVCQVAVLDPAIVYVIDKREPKQKMVVINSNIAGSEFTDCFAGDVVLKDISLPNVRIQYADLKQCRFQDMNMRNGKISDANLSGLEIDGVNISGMKLRNAGAKDAPVAFENIKIPKSTIADSDLSNVDITNCNIEGLKINGIPIEELLKSYETNRT